MRKPDFLIRRVVTHGDRPEEKVAMSADVFGKGLHSDVNAVSEGVEINSRCPSVVENDECAVFMRDSSDGRNVLDFQANGAGAFAPDEPRILLQQRTDFCADRRRIETDLDAESLQEFDREFAIGVVNAFGNENVVARFEKREVDQRDGGLAAGSDKGAVTILEFANARGEFERGWGAVEAVGVADGVLVPGIL